MTLHQLRIFSAAAKHLSVTKAGWEVHISQPSTSQQLKLLEEECGVRLYKKNGQGIELTREGRLFFKEVEPILLQVEKLKRIFSLKLHESETRLLTVGGSHAPSASFLPRLASIFRETHPHTRLILRTDNSLLMEKLVQNSHVEIAVVTSHSGAPRLVYERCRQEELVIFASSKHPVAKRQQLTLAELACMPLVIFKRGKVGGGASILHQIEEQGFRLNIVMHCETAEAAKAAVKRRMGLGILYKDLVQPDIRRGDLKIIRVPGLEMHIDSFIIYPKQKPLSSDAKDFLALLREAPKGTKKGKGPLRPAA
jgi:DNA-binding transcriptional LysR family regulator